MIRRSPPSSRCRRRRAGISRSVGARFYTTADEQSSLFKRDFADFAKQNSPIGFSNEHAPPRERTAKLPEMPGPARGACGVNVHENAHVDVNEHHPRRHKAETPAPCKVGGQIRGGVVVLYTPVAQGYRSIY